MSDRITRRRLIAGAAVAGVGAAVPAGAEARWRARGKPSTPRRTRGRPRSADVIVVGAGLSGLNAARQVVAAGKSAIVLEARDRVGGRTLNHDIGGGKVIEVGGQWIGPTQDRLAKLASEVGVSTYKTYNDGQYVYYQNGQNTPYSPSGPLGAVPPDYSGAADAFAALQRLDSMAATVPLDAPWSAPNAVEWDSQTVDTWARDNVKTSGGRTLLTLGVTSVFAQEPRDLSLLWILFYIHSAGDEQNVGTFERLVNTAGGAQESRFVGGSQLVSLKVAEQLGRRVVLGSPVRRIVQTRGGVQAVCDKFTVNGKAIIVTGPPTVTAYIDYEPQLTAQRAQLLQRFPQGSVIKCEAIYDRPFWRDAGLAGQATSDTGPVRITFDNSPPDGSPGVLLGFIEAGDARVWGFKTPDERRAGVLASFARYFGDQALRPRDYVEQNWTTEMWTRGCYGGSTPPGVLLDYGTAIRASFGRVYWAGAETSDYWNGYMDGAVRSGARAAAEALGNL